VNEHLRRAVKALETGANEVRGVSSRSVSEVRQRLRNTVEEVLQHLEAEKEEEPTTMSDLDRQSRDIAEDLRRVDRLMKQRSQSEG
jgi:uncharacterized protein YPO0396